MPQVLLHAPRDFSNICVLARTLEIFGYRECYVFDPHHVVRERYGKGDPKNFGDGAPRNLEHFLLARRLVEAGARVVTLNFGRWDFHSNNFSEAKNTHLPMFDQGLSALIEDLHARGMDQDVAVVAWGEFGRTPRINANAGRDHWPQGHAAWLHDWRQFINRY